MDDQFVSSEKVSATKEAADSLAIAAATMFSGLHFAIVAMDATSYSVRFSTECANIGALLMAGMATALEDSIETGKMHVHNPIDEALRTMSCDPAKAN